MPALVTELSSIAPARSHGQKTCEAEGLDFAETFAGHFLLTRSPVEVPESWDQHDLERLALVVHQIEPLLILCQRQSVGHDPVRRDGPIVDIADRPNNFPCCGMNKFSLFLFHIGRFQRGGTSSKLGNAEDLRNKKGF